MLSGGNTLHKFHRCISLVDLSYPAVHLVYLRKQLGVTLIKVLCLIPVIVNGLWATAKLRRGLRLMRKSPCVYCILNVDRKLAPKNRSKYPTFNLILQSRTVFYMRQSYYSNWEQNLTKGLALLIAIAGLYGLSGSLGNACFKTRIESPISRVVVGTEV